MNLLAGIADSALNLLVVIVGFGLIIFVHELGHFLAAKWAGIRVLAFALGFGPAIVSWRKGLGLRFGTTEPEYNARLKADRDNHPGAGTSPISPTEYRLNWLPFGGYVKMLGQDDADPTATSSAPDSYQSCPVWKRMIVISAGVVMNVLLAAGLFIFVFMHGLETEPARIGYVAPGSPASRAVVIDGPEDQQGLRPGDRVLSVNGREPRSFNDLVMAAAMASRKGSVRVTVERPGLAAPVTLNVQPQTSEITRLMEIGVEPSRSAKLLQGTNDAENQQLRSFFERRGLKGLEPGMRLVRVGDRADPHSAAELSQTARRSNGEPFEAVFEGDAGERLTLELKPRASLQSARVPMPSGMQTVVTHLLGLMPVLCVDPAQVGDNAPTQNLEPGDIFARLGSLEFPSIAAGIAEIQRHKGKQIKVDVLRRQADGSLARIRVEPDPTVRNKDRGQIGFFPSETDRDSTLVSLPARGLIDPAKGEEPRPSAAERLITSPGTRILAVNGVGVGNFTQLREALKAATLEAHRSSAATTEIAIRLALPLPAVGGSPPIEERSWSLDKSDLDALHELSWSSPLDPGLFEPEQILLRAEGSNIFARAGAAVGMGVAETHRVMMMTYLTFARLFEGTVKIEHLKGPVGIVHIGTRILDRGFIWLLFLMGLISVNLAVVNFLPLPIVDGGQFLFLLAEQVRGKPVPADIQNAASIAGLLLIGTVFLIVTFQDVANLFG